MSMQKSLIKYYSRLLPVLLPELANKKRTGFKSYNTSTLDKWRNHTVRVYEQNKASIIQDVWEGLGFTGRTELNNILTQQDWVPLQDIAYSSEFRFTQRGALTKFTRRTLYGIRRKTTSYTTTLSDRDKQSLLNYQYKLQHAVEHENFHSLFILMYDLVGSSHITLPIFSPNKNTTTNTTDRRISL